MEPVSIAALIAMIASAAVQYQSQVDAQDRQQQAIRNSLDAQEQLQKEAEQKAMKTAETFNPLDRMKEQAALETQITDNLITPVAASQAARAENAGAEGQVSDDYTVAKAKSDASTLKNAETLARLLGKTASSSRLRLNEGVRLLDTGMAMDQLHNFSKGQMGADQIAIDVAKNEDPNMVLAGEALGILGSAGMAYSAANAGKVASAGAASASGGLASNGLNAAADFKSYALPSETQSWINAFKYKPA